MQSKTPYIVILVLILLFGVKTAINAPQPQIQPVQLAGATSTIPKYDRSYFKHWSDLDKDGEDTREEALKMLDLDHIVPLKLAWVSGAYSWTPAQREQFANDLDNLQLLPASVNRSKGDKGIDEWLPDYKPCEYARKYLAIKHKYKLLVTPQELAVEVRECK